MEIRRLYCKIINDYFGIICNLLWGFPGSSACSAGDPGLVPESGRSLGERNGYPLQYSCLENPINRGDWQATVCGVAKSQTRLND